MQCHAKGKKRGEKDIYRSPGRKGTHGLPLFTNELYERVRKSSGLPDMQNHMHALIKGM